METALQAMKSGAVDFIAKPFNDEALLDAINAALALDRGPTRDRESVVAAKLMAKLSPRERQVLDGLVGGRSTKQIAYDLGVSARTVEVHAPVCWRDSGPTLLPKRPGWPCWRAPSRSWGQRR